MPVNVGQSLGARVENVSETEKNPVDAGSLSCITNECTNHPVSNFSNGNGVGVY